MYDYIPVEKYLCEGGYYCEEGSTNKRGLTENGETQCPTTAPYSPAGSSSISECTDECPAGFYCPPDSPQIQCPEDTCSPPNSMGQGGGGEDDCIYKDGECSPGYYLDNSIQTPCPIGTYKSGNETSITDCIGCPEGKYTDEPGQAICKICEANHKCVELHPPNDYPVQIPCSDDQYSPIGSAECYSCSEHVVPDRCKKPTNTITCKEVKDLYNRDEGYCCGNDDGVISSSTPINDIVNPIEYIKAKTMVRKIASGRWHICYIDAYNTLRCWGQNLWGNLGTGDSTTYNNYDSANNPTYSRTATPAVWSNITQVVAKDYTTCAITVWGHLHCWGFGYFGNLGIGTTGWRWWPQWVNFGKHPHVEGDGVDKKVLQVSVSTSYTCAIVDDLHLYCWGNGAYGKLGSGSISNNWVASNGRVDLGSKWPIQVATSSKTNIGSLGGFDGDLINPNIGHTCVVLNDHTVKCWGFNNLAQCGYETDVIKDIDGIYSDPWGMNCPDGYSASACKYINTIPKYLPSINLGIDPNNNLPYTSKQVAVGLLSTCVILNTGDVSCWGSTGNMFGGDRYVLSAPPTGQRDPYFHCNHATSSTAWGCIRKPLIVLHGAFKQIVMDGFRTCAVMNSGGITCTRYNTNYQNVREISHVDHSVQYSSQNYQSSTCAIVENNGVEDLKCWGYSKYDTIKDGYDGHWNSE